MGENQIPLDRGLGLYKLIIVYPLNGNMIQLRNKWENSPKISRIYD